MRRPRHYKGGDALEKGARGMIGLGMIGFGQTRRPAANAMVLLGIAALLAGCESSSRLGSLLPDDPFRPAPRVNTQAPAPLTPAPAGDVESTALPPPPGASTAALPPQVPAPGAPSPVGVGAPLAPQQPTVTSPSIPPAPRVATAPSQAPVAAPSRTALIGNWSVSEAAGSSCRITLSSAPKLDLYGAGTSGCQNKELQRVNAWELAGSEVILYEPGGGVVARLRQAGGQNYAGATAKSGAPVSISK